MITKISLIGNIVLIIVILFLSMCSGANCPDITTKTDTVTVTVVDTVYFEHKQRSVSIKPNKPIISVYSPSLDNNTTKLCDSVRTYVIAFEDSLLKGSYTADVRGELIGGKLDYTPLFPKHINTTNTVTITKTNTIVKPIFGVGMMIGVSNPQTQVSVLGYYVAKNGLTAGYGYDLLGQGHNVMIGFGIR